MLNRCLLVIDRGPVVDFSYGVRVGEMWLASRALYGGASVQALRWERLYCGWFFGGRLGVR
jgi:hypothetical protein